MKPLFMFVLLFAFLSGCSLKPQVLDLSLAADAKESPVPLSASVFVKVEDKRDIDVLGYHRKVRSSDTEVRSAQPLGEQLKEAIELALTRQGFQVKSASQEVDSVFTLYVEELIYSTPDEEWVSEINLRGRFRVGIEREEGPFTKTFSSNQSRQVAVAPTEEYNRELISAFISDLLTKVTTHPDVTKYLNGQR